MQHLIREIQDIVDISQSLFYTRAQFILLFTNRSGQLFLPATLVVMQLKYLFTFFGSTLFPPADTVSMAGI